MFSVLEKLIAAAYTANFAAVRVLTSTATSINDLADLPKTAPIGTMCGWAMEPWLRTQGYSNIVCYENKQDDTISTMTQQIESGLMANRYVAFFMTTPELSLITKLSDCRIQGVGQSYHVRPMGFQFNKQVPAFVKSELNAAVIKAWDSGFLANQQVQLLQ
jgi:hypothetical protein